MIRKVEINFNFNKLAEALGNDQALTADDKLAINKRLVANARQRLTKGTVGPALEDVTVDIRNRIKAQRLPIVTKKNPLYATGQLYDSLEATPAGIKMVDYGWKHQNGYYQEQTPFMEKFNIGAQFIRARPFIPTTDEIKLPESIMAKLIRTFENISKVKPRKR